MWFIVRSPHDGREVKVRDKDVGRAIRDGEGNLFYVLPRANGQGHYGSLTRLGGPEQESRYDTMLAQEGHAQQLASEATSRAVHDARGKPRRGPLAKLAAIATLAAALAGGYLYFTGKLSGPAPTTPAPTQPAPADPDAKR